MFQVLAGEGRVYKCLFNHKFEEAMSERVSPIPRGIKIFLVLVLNINEVTLHPSFVPFF